MRFLKNLKHLKEIGICRRETPQWLRLTLSYLHLYPIDYPYEIKLRSGEILKLREPMDLVIFWLVFARRHYPVSGSEKTIADIGANIGLFTLYAARQAPSARIIAIEPFPDTFRRLTEHIQINHLETRVHCLNLAVTGSAGTTSMDTGPGVPSQHRRVLGAITDLVNANYKDRGMPHKSSSGGLLVQEELGETPVRMETLAAVLRGQNVQSLDLVKMNIHGTEYEVLLGTPPDVLRRLKRLALEYHEIPKEFNLGKQQLFERLTKAGLELTSDNDTQRGAGLAVFDIGSRRLLAKSAAAR